MVNTEHQLKWKLAWNMYKDSNVKIKMAQEQWVQLKMTLLLGYNLNIVILLGKLTFGGGVE